MRIAVTKFMKSGICTYVHEAVQKMFDEYLEPFFKKFDSHIFRQEKLWCEHCDLAFKRNLNAVKAVYTKFSGKYAYPGAPKFMSLDEFTEFVTICGVISD